MPGHVEPAQVKSTQVLLLMFQEGNLSYGGQWFEVLHIHRDKTNDTIHGQHSMSARISCDG